MFGETPVSDRAPRYWNFIESTPSPASPETMTELNETARGLLQPLPTKIHWVHHCCRVHRYGDDLHCLLC